MDDKQFMQRAMEKAKESVAKGGFPAGAVVVKNGQIVGEGASLSNKLNDPTSHGEIASIRDACKNLGTPHLSGAILYASMQPCLMCLGATMWSEITKIVFACPKEKVSIEYFGGHYQSTALNSQLTHPLELVYLEEFEAESLAIVHDWEKAL